ncbi:MAG: M23 family metallopeptidase [Pseudomonadota bacterium]
MREAICVALSLSFAAPAAAKDILLAVPIDCEIGTACFIQQYVDHDTSPEAMDFRCSNLSYDTHQGTDFALKSIGQMRDGVDVVAAAPGVVKGTRDGMEDRLFRAEDSERINGRDCGNGVLIEHADGWSTQYCHLKRGSVAVRTGDSVDVSTILGQVGLSGRTQFPHLHLTVRKDNAVVDPFDPDGDISCDAPSTHTLWSDPPAYQPCGLLDAGFADQVPDFNDIKAGTAGAVEMPTDAPALVLFGYAFGGQAGDRMQLRIDGPAGTVIDEEVEIDRAQAQFFRAVGTRRKADAWPVGQYTGTVILTRGQQEVNRIQTTTTLK